MNICFYTDQTISGMTGGIGRISSVITNHFKNEYGWKVFSIYAFEANKDCVLTDLDGSIKLRLHDRLNIKRSVKKNYPKAVDFIQENKIDVVIIQTSLDVVSKLREALDKRNMNHVKLLSVLHFAPSKDEWPWPKKGLKGLIAPLRNSFIHRATIKAYQSAYEKGEKVILLSNQYIQEYQQYAQIKENKKLVVIPNCLSFEENFTSSDLQQKQDIALVVARMEDRQKRISLILKMWKKIEETETQKPWLLQIVGDGPSLSHYQRMARELNLQHISFEGKQNPIPYYQKASVFLMTSSFEGFPMTLVEAAQFGCVPIVYNSFNSLNDVIINGENGFIVNDKDEAEYIKHIKILLNNREKREQMAQKAIDFCLKFSRYTVCNIWKNLIESL